MDFPFSLLTEASVNLADDDDLLTRMKDAGFRRVFLGIETPVEESLKEAQKPQNRGNLARVSAKDSESRHGSDGWVHRRLRQRSRRHFRTPDRVHSRKRDSDGDGRNAERPSRHATLEATRKRRTIARRGRDRKQHDRTVNFVPKMDVDKLISGYQRIMRTIYKPSEYYRRALDSLQRTYRRMFPRRTSITVSKR
jgi:hypothetical protein